jgi:uncharacterized protein (DUF342 family)
VNEVLSEDQLVKLEAHKEAQKAARKTAKAEINEYRKQNVKPVVKAERVAFEKLLSEEEKETIEAARAMKPKRDGNKKGSMTKEDREQRKESMTQIKLLLDPIVENHKTELAKVEERLKPVKQEAKTHAENTLSANGIEKRKRKKNKTPKENGSYKFLLMKA